MNPWMKRWLPLALILLISTGCDPSDPTGNAGGNDGGGGSGGGPAVINPTLDELPEVFGDAICEYFERCDLGILIESSFNENCRTHFARNFEDTTLDDFRRLIDAEKAEYHGDQVAACVSGINQASCDEDILETLPEACQQVLVGLTQEDEDCVDADECAYGLYCRTEGQCPGTCTARSEEGGPCRDGSVACVEGLVCTDDGCRSPIAEGEPCEDTDQCASNLDCLENEAGNSVCTARSFASLDEACDPNQEIPVLCGGGSVCTLEEVDPNTGDASFVCKAQVGVDQPCTVGFPSHCELGLYCAGLDPQAPDLEGTCQTAPVEGDAEAVLCVQEYDDPDAPFYCGLGNICAIGFQDEPSVCRTHKRLGEACLVDNECYSGGCVDDVCVNPTNNFCLPDDGQ